MNDIKVKLLHSLDEGYQTFNKIISLTYDNTKEKYIYIKKKSKLLLLNKSSLNTLIIKLILSL